LWQPLAATIGLQWGRDWAIKTGVHALPVAPLLRDKPRGTERLAKDAKKEG